MFDVKNFALPRKMTLAEALNCTLCDLMSHRRPQLRGFRFVGRGRGTAYLSVPGNPKGATCVSLEEGDIQAIIFYHPSRYGKEAWEMSATSQGCSELCDDVDMEEDREWATPKHDPYMPPRVGQCSNLYEVVITILKRYVSTAEDFTPLPDECYF